MGWVEYGNGSNVRFGFALIEITNVERCCCKEHVGATAGCQRIEGVIKRVVIKCNFLTGAAAQGLGESG